MLGIYDYFDSTIYEQKENRLLRKNLVFLKDFSYLILVYK